LHCAVLKETASSLAVVKLLLESGADATAENDFGDSPVSIATSKKYAKLLPLLEAAAQEQAEREAAERKAKAEAKKKAAGKGEAADAGPSLPYRRSYNQGWKPLSKDWNGIVQRRKPLTDNLAGRKVALSFSNKATDAAFAKELHAALKVAGCECRLLTKWPVNGWVQACVWAADEADFCIVLNSANYNEGHYSCAAVPPASVALASLSRRPQSRAAGLRSLTLNAHVAHGRAPTSPQSCGAVHDQGVQRAAHCLRTRHAGARRLRWRWWRSRGDGSDRAEPSSDAGRALRHEHVPVDAQQRQALEGGSGGVRQAHEGVDSEGGIA